MRSIAWMLVATALSTVGCATGGKDQAFSTISGREGFRIFASTEEVASATRLVVERLGMLVLHEDAEEWRIEVGSSDGMPLFVVSIEPDDRQLLIMTSYYREAPGTDLGPDEAESLVQQVRQINDAILTVLENLPPRVPSESGLQSPPTA